MLNEVVHKTNTHKNEHIIRKQVHANVALDNTIYLCYYILNDQNGQ